MRNLACVALLVVAAPVCAEDIFHSFRGRTFDENSLRFTGGHTDEVVTTEEGGLRVRFTPGDVAKEPAGVFWRYAVRGDFVTTATYEILQADRPKTGWGVGVEMYLKVANANADGIALSRVIRPDGKPVVAFNYITNNEKGKRSAKVTRRFPSTMRSEKGRLRLERAGTTLIASIAEADEGFRELHRMEIDAADLREVRATGYSGGDPKINLDLKLLDFQLKGDRLVHDSDLPAPEAVDRPPAVPDAAAAPQPDGDRTFLVLAILLVALIALVLLILFLISLRLREAKSQNNKAPGKSRMRQA